MNLAHPLTAQNLEPGLDVAQEFPGLEPGWSYLDSAATAQKPRVVIEAVARALGEDYGTVHRGVYRRSADMTEAYEAAREAVARFVGARAREVVFTRGATEAINLVAQSWGSSAIGSGDHILLSELEHHANIVPWVRLAQARGAVIDVAPLTPNGAIDAEAAAALVGPATKLVALSHLSNVTGALLDPSPIVEACRRQGARLLLDSCQAAPRVPIDVAALGVDFLVFSSHKLYGPTGIGVLWARGELLDAMPPWQGGGAMIDTVTFEEVTYLPPPQRFEAGTPAIAEAIGLHAALRWVSSLGLARIGAHERALGAQARERLACLGARLWGPAESHGIVSFTLDSIHPHDVATILDEHGVAVRAGHHCAQPLMRRLGVDATVRASFAAYSSAADVDRLADAVARVQRIFGRPQ